ncbi:hypothetical protein RCG24_19080 [Neobacillus sp. OS1-32]|jgi:hypothetical protein|uniref:Uncharacterized protein n=1 Tax=Neobacillus paridis TaxID=2803862 RepID=A0ABS1THY5_9BACI|nr:MULTISPECIES: hypothetical protein [Neobacillus]MBL4950931.1 hypothetical protein [Neobacillus paridis]WML29981.1 hypothetical protein RCG24_19080 [Neobacillus sp. OS1-32]
MKLSLGNIHISSIGNSSAVFFGETNTLKQFQSDTILEEVVGSISGKDNILNQGYWVKTVTRKDE